IEYWPLNPLEISHNYLKKQFISSKDIRFDIKINEDLRTIKPSGGVSFYISSEHLGVKFPEQDSELLVPVRLKNPTSLLIARLDIYSPVDTSLKVSYNNRLPTKWTEERFFTDYIKRLFKLGIPESKHLVREESFEVKLKGGRDTYYISIDAENLVGPLKLQLTPGTTEYKIFDFEIRNIPYPHQRDNTP
ncbi:hypothetical protein J7M23_08700, partial [Candidatus Sumerlaeota bacterium]|nr:hypothetical protein [Candidatus Sumerlaeota bacterium]